jgi:hypothetical protein
VIVGEETCPSCPQLLEDPEVAFNGVDWTTTRFRDGGGDDGGDLMWSVNKDRTRDIFNLGGNVQEKSISLAHSGSLIVVTLGNSFSCCPCFLRTQATSCARSASLLVSFSDRVAHQCWAVTVKS